MVLLVLASPILIQATMRTMEQAQLDALTAIPETAPTVQGMGVAIPATPIQTVAAVPIQVDVAAVRHTKNISRG